MTLFGSPTRGCSRQRFALASLAPRTADAQIVSPLFINFGGFQWAE